MTENEALEKHKEDCRKCWDKACEHNIQCLQKKDIEVYERLMEFESIDTIEKFKSLKEKSVAKKPIRSDLCTCPSCGTHNEIIKKRRNTVTFDTVYCWHCGQAIEIKCD